MCFYTGFPGLNEVIGCHIAEDDVDYVMTNVDAYYSKQKEKSYQWVFPEGLEPMRIKQHHILKKRLLVMKTSASEFKEHVKSSADGLDVRLIYHGNTRLLDEWIGVLLKTYAFADSYFSMLQDLFYARPREGNLFHFIGREKRRAVSIITLLLPTDLPDVAFIYNLATTPEAQHRGYASKMLKTAVNTAECCGRKYIELNCDEPLEGFYNRFGFERKLAYNIYTHQAER